MKFAVEERRSVRDQLSAPRPSGGRGNAFGQTTNILVVDDDKTICEILSLYLEMKGMHVRTAQSLLGAVSLDSTRRFDLAILDWDLDGVEALEVLNFFKGTRPEMPVIIFTGKEVDEAFLKGALAGRADAVLPKMGSLDALASEVHRQLTKQRRQAGFETVVASEG